MKAWLETLPVSPLQLGLIVMGVLLLLVLILWNGWSTRRRAPKQPDPAFDPAATSSLALTPSASAAEPLEAQQRLEPVFDPGVDGQMAAADPSGQVDPGLGPASASAEPRRALLDPLIDVIAPVTLDAPVAGAALLQALPATRRVGSKPFAVEALAEDADAWSAPRAGLSYRRVQAGVQMANRSGALNEIEFSEFVMKTQSFADAIGASCEFPEMLHEVARAKELDQFAGDHDAQLGLHVHAQGAAWSPGYVQQHATRLGFTPGAIPGRMVLAAAQTGSPPLLTLSFDTQAALAEDPTQAALREVRLSLDVPQVNRGARPFVKMREVADALAGAMEGVVTDERGQRLPPAAMDQIQSEVERLYDQLDARDLSAGSPLAQRVFS